MDVIEKQVVTPSVRKVRKIETVFDYLTKCGGKDIFHFNDHEDMKLNMDDAYQFAQDLRSALHEAYGDDAPTVTHSTNRVILSFPYEKV